jgi:hypothetical protein
MDKTEEPHKGKLVLGAWLRLVFLLQQGYGEEVDLILDLLVIHWFAIF